jgi:hypothetical protein
MRVQPTDRAPHWKCLNDWLQTYTQQPVSKKHLFKKLIFRIKK